MAKKAYIGVDGVARKIKKGYVGVGDVARKIKKAYVGVGGVARPFWSGGEIEYYGYLENLKRYSSNENKRYGLASGVVGDYAVFAGGLASVSGSSTSLIDVYNKSLTKVSTSITLPKASSYLSGAETPSYVVFFGGSASALSCAVNASLTLTTLSIKSQPKSTNNAGGSIGDCAVFAGGLGNFSTLGTVYSFNNSLTSSRLTDLSQTREYLKAASIGSYLIFAGGRSFGDIYSKSVDVYNSSLTKVSNISDMSHSRSIAGAASNGNYAIFTGGRRSSSSYNQDADAYNSSLTISTIYTYESYKLAGISHPLFALFSGGSTSNGGMLSRVFSVDNSLTVKNQTALPDIKEEHSGELIGEYGLFAGGSSTSVVAYMMPE